MINPKEIIDGYLSEGYSRKEALVMAKNDIVKQNVSLSNANKKAELDRIKNYIPAKPERSVVYGAKKGVM